MPMPIALSRPVTDQTGRLEKHIDGSLPYTHQREILTHESAMRTNIDIDDDLMREAMRASGAATKRAAVEQGLRLLIDVRGQRTIRRLRGKVKWVGDLEATRMGRVASDR